MSGAGAAASPPPAARKRPIVLGAIFVLAGIGLPWLAWSYIDEVRQLARSGMRAEATVTSMEEHRSRRSGSTFYPIFVWRTPEGRVVRERSAVPVTPEDYRSRRTVTIVYDPADTATARPVGSLNAGGAGIGPWILGALALICFGLGGLVLFGKQRGAPQPAPANPSRR